MIPEIKERLDRISAFYQKTEEEMRASSFVEAEAGPLKWSRIKSGKFKILIGDIPLLESKVETRIVNLEHVVKLRDQAKANTLKLLSQAEKYLEENEL